MFAAVCSARPRRPLLEACHVKNTYTRPAQSPSSPSSLLSSLSLSLFSPLSPPCSRVIHPVSAAYNIHQQHQRTPPSMSYYSNTRSPPPLQHPVPTHPAYIPEPPSTPASPQGYQRYTSSPQPQAYAQAIPPAATMSRVPQPPPYGAYPQMGSPPRQQPVHGQVLPTTPVDFSAWGLNDATAQFGMQLGQSAVAAGQDYVQKNVSAPCATCRLRELNDPGSLED